MAIKLSANYSKKLGLPNYSSHSFSASVEVELTDISQVEKEVQRLYQLLQQSVDQEIQHPGFVPDAATPAKSAPPQRTTVSSPAKPLGDRWNCTEGQRGFILRIISDNKMEKKEAEDLSRQLFGVGVKELNKMQASQLIEDLLDKAGKPARQTRWQQRQPTQHAA
jgi:hypothetical protein